LLHLQWRFRELLMLFHLDSVLHAYDSEDVAIDSFAPPHEAVPVRQAAVRTAAAGLYFGWSEGGD
jgi:hypothetical protein